MSFTMNEVLQFVQQNDVKFVRLAFCDLAGEQKNISIMPKELPRAFEQGISFDASAIKGFMDGKKTDLFLYPDHSTLNILPWRPQTGRVVRFYCDIRTADGTSYDGDARSILKAQVDRLKQIGIEVSIGIECKFYLFQTNEQGVAVKIPQDHATYCDIAPKDKAENVRREICLTLEEMGIIPETSHHEQGPGQNEIIFKGSDLLTAADNLITFKSVVKTVANKNGLFASFMPNPLENQPANELKLNLSVYKNGVRLFDEDTAELAVEAKSFYAGILAQLRDTALFMNPTTNSYDPGAPSKAVAWSDQSLSQLLKLPTKFNRLFHAQLCGPDTACNPYLFFALLAAAGCQGIAENQTLGEPLSAEGKPVILPQNLIDAVEAAKQSPFIAAVLPAGTFDKYIRAKETEWNDYCAAHDKDMFETQRYFYTL